MESLQIYEESLKEIAKVKKQLAFSQITINMKNLDANSKAAITYALSQALNTREKEIMKTITGAK